MEWIFRNQETVAARSKYIHQLSSSNNAHPIEYFVYCSMGTVKFELLSWFSIVRDFWRQHFSVLSQKTNNISVVSSHFHLYLRISALRLPTVMYQCRQPPPRSNIVTLVSDYSTCVSVIFLSPYQNLSWNLKYMAAMILQIDPWSMFPRTGRSSANIAAWLIFPKYSKTPISQSQIWEGCLLWVWSVTYTLCWSQHYCMGSCAMLDRVITVSDCI